MEGGAGNDDDSDGSMELVKEYWVPVKEWDLSTSGWPDSRDENVNEGG